MNSMKPHFDVSIQEYWKISALPDAWSTRDYESILEMSGYEDTNEMSDSYIREMAIMSLQEYQPEKAADLLINYRLGNKLNKEQRQELIQELQAQEIWEENGDMSLHEEIFNISSLMHSIFPKVFPSTHAICVLVEIIAWNTYAKEQLNYINESFICRLIADGISEHSILYRLFGEQLLGLKFPEADNIIWKYEIVDEKEDSLIFSAILAECWIRELKDADGFQSSAYSDTSIKKPG